MRQLALALMRFMSKYVLKPLFSPVRVTNQVNASMRILLVEDDDRIVQPLLEDLRQQHYIVDIAANGLDAWEMLDAIEYDLVILDLMLPRMDGITLCERLRNSGIKASQQTMVLMLTARDTLSDKVRGLDAGADDYVVKPFELDELAARIRMLLRRRTELLASPQQILAAPNYGCLIYDRLCLSRQTHTATYDQQPLNLTPKEFMILEYFLRSPQQVLTKESLMDRLWELDSESGLNTIKTHITNLRRKLRETGADPDLIQTVYGIGYRLMPIVPEG